MDVEFVDAITPVSKPENVKLREIVPPKKQPTEVSADQQAIDGFCQTVQNACVAISRD